MQRSFVLLALTALCFSAALTQARADEVVYVSKEKVFATTAAAGTLSTGSDHRVSMSRREEAGQSEVHDAETDVFYVMEGSATFVTGGTIVGGKTTAPGQVRGTGIINGTTHMLSKGDVVVIPKGTPHWFKEVPEVVVYFVVKAIQ